MGLRVSPRHPRGRMPRLSPSADSRVSAHSAFQSGLPETVRGPERLAGRLASWRSCRTVRRSGAVVDSQGAISRLLFSTRRRSLRDRRGRSPCTCCCISRPVSRIVAMTASRDTWCVPSPHSAIFAALTALAAQWRCARCRGSGPDPRWGRTSDRDCAPWRSPRRSAPGAGPAESLGERGRRHRRRRADLSLAPDLGTRDGSPHLEQYPDRLPAREEERHDDVFARAPLPGASTVHRI